jgi:hypothetical protein
MTALPPAVTIGSTAGMDAEAALTMFSFNRTRSNELTFVADVSMMLSEN